MVVVKNIEDFCMQSGPECLLFSAELEIQHCWGKTISLYLT
jgi:hypothetical protein